MSTAPRSSGLLSSFVEQDQELERRASLGVAPARQETQPGAADGTPVILQYAAYLGMDAAADTDLLWIAQQALSAELPAGWTEHKDPMSGEPYFHNENTGETVWEHPSDSYYRNLYQQLKKEKAQYSASAAVPGAGPYTSQEISMAVGTMSESPAVYSAARLCSLLCRCAWCRWRCYQ